MTSVLLVRHGQHDWLSKGVAGRTPDVFLNEEGRAEAVRVGHELVKLRDRFPISALYSSPVERTVETAQLISPSIDLPIITDAAFIEIDYGRWSGKTFSELSQEPLWNVWNERRSTIRIPGGETIQEVQDRVIIGLRNLGTKHPAQNIVIVSHGDPIKSVISYCGFYQLDHLASHELKPASLSLVQIDEQKISTVWYDKTADELSNCPIPHLKPLKLD